MTGLRSSGWRKLGNAPNWMRNREIAELAELWRWMEVRSWSSTEVVGVDRVLSSDASSALRLGRCAESKVVAEGQQSFSSRPHDVRGAGIALDDSGNISGRELPVGTELVRYSVPLPSERPRPSSCLLSSLVDDSSLNLGAVSEV